MAYTPPAQRQLYRIIPTLVVVLEYAKKTSEGINTGREADINYIKEKQALKAFLIDHGMGELRRIEKVKFLDGSIDTELLENKNDSEAWFNIYVEMRKADVFAIRKRVIDYGYDLLKLLNTSMVDINSFVLSFHIKIPGENMSRSIFIRTNRAELKDALSASANAEQVIQKLKNKIFDELFRDLQNTPG